MIGKTVSHYKIIDKLGGGGMGVVYRAHDQKLDRTVALKFLPHHLSHKDARRQRFYREARAASALDHPNICTIYDIDETDDGQTFIAMGYCAGESLGDVIARGALPIEDAVDIAAQVAGGLACAHARGIVHRDIKPANIIVTAEGRVKIIDFGLAKLEGQPAVTREGTMLGTMGYTSPEQAQGSETDHRTDIWALGTVLYEMIAGKHPFVADHQAAVLYRIVNEDPPPVKIHRKETPNIIQEIIERALAKDPSDRFETMNEMASLLEAGFKESAVSATVKPSSILARARKALASCDWPEAFAAFTEAATRSELAPEDLDGWADAASWMNRVDITIKAREGAHAKYIKAGRYSDAARAAIELANDNSTIGARSVSNGWVQRAEKLLEGSPKTLERGYLERLKAKMAIQVDGDLDAALEHAGRALELADEHGDADLRALAIQDRGRALVLQNRVSEGMELLDEAMATAISGELSPVVVGVTYCNMISTCASIADYRRAGEWSDSAIRWCQVHSDSAFTGICGVRRAEVMQVRGDWSEAESEAQKASERDDGYVTAAAAEAYYLMGVIKLRRGEFEAAEGLFEESHRRGRLPVPGMAQLRAAQGRLDAAKSLMERALSADAMGVERARLLPAGVEIALLSGDIDRAKSCAEELASLAANLGSIVFSGHSAHATGAVLFAQGKVEDALSSLTAACRDWQAANAPYEEARTRLLLATAYRAGGDNDLAKLETLAARTIFERLGASPDVGRADSLPDENPQPGSP